MQYTVSAQQQADLPLPEAYELYRRTVADELYAQFRQLLADEPWPPLLGADPATGAQLTGGMRSATFERYALQWMDARIREQAPARWPSARIGSMVPRVLPLYKLALSDAECAVDRALRAAVVAHCRTHIAQCMFDTPRSARRAPAPVFPDPRMLLPVDTSSAGAGGVAQLLGLAPTQLVMAGLPHTRRAIEELLRPQPGDLQRYGDNEKLLTLKDDVASLLAEPMVRDMREVFGGALKGAPAKMDTPAAVIEVLLDAEETAIAELEDALLTVYLRTLKTAVVVTQYELDTVLPRYVAQLESTWGDVAQAFSSLLDDARTLDQLEAMFTEDVTRRAEHTITVVESYRHAAPVVAGGGTQCGDPIQGMPQTRDASLLLDTPIGMHVLRLSQVLRAVMPTKSGALAKLYAEMPRGMPEVMTGPGFAAGAPVSRRSDPMDLVADYFYRAINPNPFTGTTTNVAMHDKYMRLLRQKAVDAAARAAAAARRR